MANTKTITELTTLPAVDKTTDWLPVVDTSDTTESVYGTTKKALVDQFVGEKGDTGDAATLDVGTTTTGDAGTDAVVTNSGSTSAAVFNFTIPKGDQGVQGEKGDTGTDGTDGVDGVDGDSAYLYIAYASDDSGTGFTTTFNSSLDYIAAKSVTSPIASPSASDFTGLWKNYKGSQGIQGIQGIQGVAGTDGTDGTDGEDGVDGANAYVYVAYASDDSGTDFTTTFNNSLNYIAIKATTVEITTPQASDFVGLWKNYKGEQGIQGIQGEPGTDGTDGTDGEDGLDITWRNVYDTGTTYNVNDAVFYDGSSYICILESTGNLPTNDTYWDLMAQEGAAGAGSGDVSGPSSATDNAIARFDTTTGKLIQNSSVTIDDSGSINIPSGQQYLVNGSPVEGYSDEQAQDAIGAILTDTSEIDFTYTDETPSITASIKSASIDETKLDTSVNDSLDLADSAIQAGDLATVATTGAYSDLSGTPDLSTKIDKATNITALNDTGIADGEIAVFNLTNKDIRTSDKTLVTTLGNDDTTVPTSKAVKDVTDGKITAFADPNADRIVFWDDSAGAFTALTASTGLTITGTNMTVRTSSVSQTGIVELATTAETQTGTDATRAVTPDGLHDMTTLAGAGWFLDEDAMTSNDATKVASQQSVKAYVDGTKFAWKGAWATSTTYVLNDVIEYNGSGYICEEGHTSGTFTTDYAAGKWGLFVEGVGGNSLQIDCSGGTSDTYGALSGSVNGSNTTFTVSLSKYVSGSLQVYLNGQLQTQGTGEDWVETTPASGTFDFNTAPTTGDIILAIYQYSTSATGNADTLDGVHLSGIIDTIYPVGSIYISTVSTNPATLFGRGTWVAFGAGKTLVGLDSSDADFDTVEETGGEKTHTLTTAEMPSHTHTQNSHNHSQNAHTHTVYGNVSCVAGSQIRDPAASSGTANVTTGSTTATNNATTATNKNTGGGDAHNNLQPYIVTYMFKRTA